MSDEPTYLVNYAPVVYDVFISDGGARDYTDREVAEHDASNIAHNFIHGNMYAFQVARVIAAPVQITWYEVTGDLTGGVTYGCSFQNSHEIIFPTAGDYFIAWSMSLTSGTNDQVMGAIGVNNVSLERSAGHSTVAISGRFVSVSGNTVVTLAANEAVSLFVLNESSTTSITLEHATLSAFRIGP